MQGMKDNLGAYQLHVHHIYDICQRIGYRHIGYSTSSWKDSNRFVSSSRSNRVRMEEERTKK